MIDIQLLRKDTDGVAARLASRGYTLDTEAFRALEAERKDVQTRTEALQARRNALNAVLREFADASHGRHLFVDLESALRRANASAAEVAHRFADDVHLTPHGYNELASVVGDALLAGGAAACPLFDAAGMARRLRVTSLRDSERPLCYADVG
jgi:hypothetical protein